MAKNKPQPTAADYLVIAVSPALIMLMIGSLLWYITAAVYQDRFPERLDFCIAMFVLGAVCVARISIEEGYEYAAIYGVPLALVLLMALHRFVPMSLWLSSGMLLVTWYLADRLTWDCTFIDERQTDGGQGLLQTMGLDGDADHAGLTSPGGTTSPDDPKSWFVRWRARRKNPHPHGVWVIYFALAALPMFAVGQLGVMDVALAARREVLGYAVVYLASALGLLATTSFLGMRRYLRQRNLPMPASMAVTWSVTGGLVLLGVLILALFIPRSNAEYAVSQFPGSSQSATPSASKHALRGEGTENGTQDDAGASTPDETAKNPPSGQDGSQPSDDASQTKQGEQGNTPSDTDKSETPSQSSTSDTNSNNATQQTTSSNETTPPPSAVPNSLPLPVGVPLAIARFIVYAVLGLAALYGLWLGREKILLAWQRWLQKWHEFWAKLFGYQRSREGNPADYPRRAPQPFSTFTDPFQTGQASRMSLSELVEYTFAATEAWAQEFAIPRAADQTPSEFARQLATNSPNFADEAWLLAEVYNYAAYAPRKLGPQVRSHLQRIWLGLHRAQAVTASPPMP
jgi:hypothetical protein